MDAEGRPPEHSRANNSTNVKAAHRQDEARKTRAFRTEAPALQGSFEENEADGVKFLGVNVRDEAPAAEAFKRTFELTFPSVIDADGGAVAALSNVLPPQATPSTVVLDREGRAAARVVGEVDESTLNGLIDDVLAEDS